MKTQRLLAVVSVAILTLICIQQTADAYLVITPQVGLSGSRLTTDPEIGENKGMRVGWQVGGYLRMLGERFYLQPGVFWYKTSTKLETKESIAGTNVFANTVNYVQVPLLLGWNIVNSGTFNLRLQGGGGANIITGMSDNVLLDKENLEDVNWLLKFAVGADIGIFTMDLGYDKGMSEMFKTDAENTGKLDSVFFNLGLRFWM